MRVLLVDDHPLFIDGISGMLMKLEDEVSVTTAGSCEEAFEISQDDDDFDLLLLDLNLPGMSGLEGMNQLRDNLPATPIVLLSASEDRNKVLQAIEQGAKGFIPKSSESSIILNALQLVLSGGVYLPMAILDSVNTTQEVASNADGQNLTPRQIEVLKHLAKGLTNKGIARELSMAENTVRVHVSAILKFLDVTNRTEAGVAAVKMGLITDD